MTICFILGGLTTRLPPIRIIILVIRPVQEQKRTQMLTLRQLEALRYVYFLGLTYEQAGLRMGITKQAVGRLMLRIWIKTDKARLLSSTRKKKISYVVTMDCDVKRKF